MSRGIRDIGENKLRQWENRKGRSGALIALPLTGSKCRKDWPMSLSVVLGCALKIVSHQKSVK